MSPLALKKKKKFLLLVTPSPSPLPDWAAKILVYCSQLLGNFCASFGKTSVLYLTLEYTTYFLKHAPGKALSLIWPKLIKMSAQGNQVLPLG